MAQVSAVFKIILDGDGNVTGTGINNPANPEPLAEIDPQNPTMPKNGVRQMAGLAVAGYMGKQAVSFVSSRIEEYTGNARLQRAVNAVGTGLRQIGEIAANPLLGTLEIATQGIMMAIDESHRLRWENERVEQLRRRAGFYATGRSRE